MVERISSASGFLVIPSRWGIRIAFLPFLSLSEGQKERERERERESLIVCMYMSLCGINFESWLLIMQRSTTGLDVMDRKSIQGPPGRTHPDESHSHSTHFLRRIYKMQ